MSVDMNAVSETRTICEILREIHDIALEKGLDDIAYLAIEATLMAKKMSNKLCEYKEFSEVNKDLRPAKNPNYYASLLKRKERNEGH